ncbi:unnamed protein product [Leptosia nina]|uniref:U6 snRNA phosphodiesterase n=1 Tax=Leptosia nina TaxID=320188 RepID=A0AAV1K397_9NEOP
MSGLLYLCEYESGESESDVEEIPPKKSTKLPTPDLSKVATVPTDLHVDDPKEHNGRIRSFPHVRGNWASFAFVKYPEEDIIYDLLEKIKIFVKPVCEPSFNCEDLHISVSKTIVLKYHLISSFTTSLQKELSVLKTFAIGFDSVQIYTNEEKTRTFLALNADFYSKKHLEDVVDKINRVLEDYSLPTFYDNPSFHMSILWWNGDLKKSLSKQTKQLNNILLQEKKILPVVNIAKIDCKVGNKYFQFHLD